MAERVAPPEKPFSTKLISFFATVLVFVMAGPPIGAIAFWLALLGMQVLGGRLPRFELVISVVVIIYWSYLVGIIFAIIAGIIVAAAGVWLRWSNVVVAIVAGLSAYAIVLFAGNMSFVSASLGSPNMFTDLAKFADRFVPICVLSSICCWYLSRPLVRASWPTQ